MQLGDIVQAGMRLYSDRASIDGPAILVSAKQAQTLALVIHELATNAFKYGALSTSSGRVEITWKVEDTDSGKMFSLKWKETGGPYITPPENQGFGSVIIATVVGRELGCTPSMEFLPEGLQYRLQCQVEALLSKSD